MGQVVPTERRSIEISATTAMWEAIEKAAEEAAMSVDMFCAAAVVDAAVAASQHESDEEM